MFAHSECIVELQPALSQGTKHELRHHDLGRRGRDFGCVGVLYFSNKTVCKSASIRMADGTLV